MSAVALGVAAALVALRCELIRDDPYVLGSVSRVIPSTRPAFLNALNATRRLIGCPVDDDVVEPPPPFVGGQCDAVYLVVITGTGETSGGTPVSSTITRRVRGPISGVRQLQPPDGNGTWQILSRNVSPPTTVTCGALASGTLAWRDLGVGGTNWTRNNSITIDSATNCGGPDDCGSLPPDYPPPTNFTTNINITYNIDDGTEITVNAPFVFAPITANFNGTLRIPFTFDLGGFEFSGDINLPDFNVTVNPPALPPGSGEDLTPVGADDEGETVPPAPPDEKIIGVVVNTSSADSRRVSSYSSPGIPPIFAPRLGSVKFAYSIGAATFWSSDIDIKGDRTFIECPFSQGADAVVASPQPGVALTFVPIRGFPLATTGDLTDLT